MENKQISVIIPLYNKADTICRAINCVLSQTYPYFELIIVNDGSTDGSGYLVRQFSDSRIKLIEQRNSGVSKARNIGIREANSEYITFLDADDEWEETYLATQVAMIDMYPKCEVFTTNYQFRFPDGTLSTACINNLGFKGKSGVMEDYFYIASTSHPPITSISVLIKREALMKVGGFPNGIRSGEDLLTWARLACRCKIAFNKKICATYNLGDGYDFSNLPPRRQDKGDPVGAELNKLLAQYKNSSLRLYISHWHKMRASVAVRYGETFETISESIKALRYNPLNFKSVTFIVLALMPGGVRKKIISLKKHI